MPRIYKRPVQDAVLRIITENPGITFKEMLEELPHKPASIHSALLVLRRDLKLIYRSGWVPNLGTGGLHSPRFSAGQGQEPPRPKTDRKSYHRRYYKNHRLRLKQKAYIRLHGKPNPFLI